MLSAYEFPLAEADDIDPDSFKTDLKEFFQGIAVPEGQEETKGVIKNRELPAS